MKPIAILFFALLSSHFCLAQQPDLCRYFTLSVSRMDIKGEWLTIASPKVNDSVKDAFGQEVNLHHSRYDYLLIHYFHNSPTFLQLFPDSVKITKLFCKQLNEDSAFRKNFELICPDQFLKKKIKKVQFSSAEMMLVASRFFYCSKVNKDTAIIPKICAGSNGIKDITTKQNTSALEAFVFEAIFYLMDTEQDPGFVTDFYKSVRKSMDERKKNIVSLDDFLLNVRNDCFADMEQNEILKNSLLSYYQTNKSTINFTIQ